MNKKNKVLLSTVGLLLLSGIAATSSTFAWFTTIRTAKVNFGEAEVVTKSGDLAIEYFSSKNTNVADTKTGKVITLTGMNKVTDISGDGKTFYKPVWFDSDATVASVINDVTSTADGHYVDFTIKVSRLNDIDDNGLKVYLGAGTEIVGKTDADQQALNDSVVAATRLAVLDHTGEVILRWAPVEENSAKYLVAGTGAYGTDTHQLQSDTTTTLKSGEISDFTTIAAADGAGFLVANLASGTSKEAKITFRAWIEGEDTQTTNAIIGGVFNVNIALYALEA